MEKIQELTEKIFHEGVEKGQAEAQRIIAEAKEQAAKIVAEAKEQAAAIDTQARKAAQELDSNTKGELKLYTSQALNALKSEITNVLCNSTVEKAAATLAADQNFLGQFAVALASKWADGEAPVISTSEADALKAYFAAEAADLLAKGVKIEKVNGKDTLFTIAPADGSYKVNFGKEEFEAYFKNFLRPQLVEMLF